MVDLTRTVKEMELIDIEKLIPYANNARKHPESQMTKLRSSMRKYGFVSPVVIDRDMNIIVGHGRVEAAKAVGIKEAPCVYADHLSEAEKKAYIIADNRMAEDAVWDQELLTIELEDLQAADFDMSALGFDEDELSEFFSGVLQK